MRKTLPDIGGAADGQPTPSLPTAVWSKDLASGDDDASPSRQSPPGSAGSSSFGDRPLALGKPLLPKRKQPMDDPLKVANGPKRKKRPRKVKLGEFWEQVRTQCFAPDVFSSRLGILVAKFDVCFAFLNREGASYSAQYSVPSKFGVNHF